MKTNPLFLFILFLLVLLPAAGADIICLGHKLTNKCKTEKCVSHGHSIIMDI